MNVNRRKFLLFFGASASSIAWDCLGNTNTDWEQESFKSGISKAFAEIPNSSSAAVNHSLKFQPIKVPLPLEINKISVSEQIQVYSSYETQDDLVLPEGFTYDLVAAWGDRVGDSRFGYNNDYLSLIETAPNEALLTVNFEYISGSTWMQTYPLVIGKQLPFAEVKAKTEAQEGEIDAFSLSDDDELKIQIKDISREGLIDQGLGVISLRRKENGQWERTYSEVDRRITGISGLDDSSQSLKSTGPGIAIFTKQNKLGYEDALGDRIIGTFQNCAGGTTPWGTVLSAEENFQNQVPEEVMADGSSFNPAEMPFLIADDSSDGRANVFGLAGNKYGWMVEIDPANPQDYGTKHTWLGRYRHEAFGIRAVAEQNLAVYSGCDRRGGHLYKFISSDKVINPQDKANSALLETGMLYGAKLNPNGTGEWIPLNPDTPVNPVSPNQVVGGMVILPNSDRTAGGIMEVQANSEIETFRAKFKTLKDLYQGESPQEIQGAILIDAHFAASAAGVTCTSRPEDTVVAKDGTLFIAFTSGSSGSDGGPDKSIFQGPDRETEYEYGWIMKLTEDENDPAALSFTWSMLATGGEPAKGGAGFANPDNLEFDQWGNLWVVTDMSIEKLNRAVPARVANGETLSGSDLTGVFGNNSVWYIPLSGDAAGEIHPFAMGPMECECTGPMFNRDNTSLFLAVQHPGEINGIRQDMAAESREFELFTTEGKTFKQQRQVPLGSNWPSGQANQPPRPGVVAIRRINGEAIS